MRARAQLFIKMPINGMQMRRHSYGLPPKLPISPAKNERDTLWPSVFPSCFDQSQAIFNFSYPPFQPTQNRAANLGVVANNGDAIPLYSPLIPFLRTICRKQSVMEMFERCVCSRTFRVSNGCYSQKPINMTVQAYTLKRR